ncbi:uncharacterized protein LOC132294774 isoform X2 [Cornus florida]|uniref:uncharacterized protein LOC132294774 isoform X2 n=1 Tax=Cornus florida TaxID=4283 RepID=UPI0028A1268B|nr:uncharacterized protein LOC132294774 isoform X2 [Cornus florida]
MEFDVQLGLIEFAVPMVQITATLLYFLGILFIFIQEQKIKEGQYMMGLKDEIFYFSWFITYALQVSLLKILTLKISVKKLEGSYSLKFCFPMRFGVILYSTKFIKKIESNSGELPLDPVENDSGIEEDVSR